MAFNIHGRNPVTLDEKYWEEWFDPEIHEPEQFGAMLKPCPFGWLDSVEVSSLVNPPRNNREEVLDPLSVSS
jgi:putative SOS response-associated peptidase YedK